MSQYKSAWKAYPYSLHGEPWNLKPPIVALYAHILDEFEHWVTNDKLGVGYTPAQKTLANLMNVEPRQLRNYLDALRDVGLLETTLRHDKTSIYKVKHFESGLTAPYPQQQTTQASEWKQGDPVPF